MSAVHREPAGRRASSGGRGTIRRRLARILALPAVVVLALLGVVATAEVQDYLSSRSTSRSVTLALAVQDLAHELQTERGLTAGLLGGNPSFRSELGPARQRVDQQREALDGLLTAEGLVAADSEVQSRVRAALRQLDGLPAVRSATDSGSAGRAAMFTFFSDRIAALSGADVGLDRASDDQLRRGATALQALGDVSEATAQERAFLNGVFSAGGFAKGEYVQFAAMRAAKQVALARFDRFATPTEKASRDYLLGTGPARVTAHFEQVAVDAADGRHLLVNPQSWWSGQTTVLDDLRQLQSHVGSQIQVRAHELQQRATQRLAVLLGVVLLCLALSVYLAVVASRSITGPLAALAAEADSVAAERLPAAVRRVQAGDADDPAEPPAPVQVPARATEEIRSVATALDHLQAAAYGLATEQALQRRNTIDSLANLGRRNQSLIQRQLGFITSLEREEIDPAALANLFELDHLATRMRRNAASLLVLVGASSPRQWNTGVPVADVIRAAVSEVEEYRRVSLRRVDESLVVGTAVGAVAHLLSELIENGLMFSPPDSEVEVQGRRLADGYLIAITDQGIGMTADELAQANSRLRGEGDFIAAPTRFLGHFVVGQLARQSSIQVELLPSPVTGVTARVTLPGSLLSMPLSVEAGTVHARVTSDSVAGPRSPSPLREAPVPARLAAAPEPGAVGTGSGPVAPGQGDQAAPEPAPVSLPVASARPEHAPAAWIPSEPDSGAPFAPADGPAERPPFTPTGVPQTMTGPMIDAQWDRSSLPEVERTRNGLRKRLPRERRDHVGDPARATPGRPGQDGGTRVIDLDAAARPVVDDSPAEVSARLTALRAGLRRGQESPPPDRPDRPPGADQPEGSR